MYVDGRTRKLLLPMAGGLFVCDAVSESGEPAVPQRIPLEQVSRRETYASVVCLRSPFFQYRGKASCSLTLGGDRLFVLQSGAPMDAKFSADGSLIAFVRNGDMFLTSAHPRGTPAFRVAG